MGNNKNKKNPKKPSSGQPKPIRPSATKVSVKSTVKNIVKHDQKNREVIFRTEENRILVSSPAKEKKQEFSLSQESEANDFFEFLLHN